MSKLEPVRHKPVYFTHIWGGTLLRDQLAKDSVADNTGEAWEISTHKKGSSIVRDRHGNDIAFDLWLEEFGEEFFADNTKVFPLLIKFIGPKDKLSVQVHPTNDYALADTGEKGKPEAWYIIDAPKDAYIIYGTKGTKADFVSAIETGDYSKVLKRTPVKQGDVVNIPAGMVHALMPDVVICEVQASSDTTYRVYDWDRLDKATGQPRELHIDKALDVIDFEIDTTKGEGAPIYCPGGERKVYIVNKTLTFETIEVDGEYNDFGPEGFSTYTCVNGHAHVGDCFDIRRGQSFVVPAGIKDLLIFGNAKFIKASNPTVDKMKEFLLKHNVDTSKIDFR